MADIKRKINFNTPPPSSGSIASGKNFDGLFESYTKAIGATASSATTGGMSVAGAVKIGFVTVAALIVTFVTVIVVGKKIDKNENLADGKNEDVVIVSKLEGSVDENRNAATFSENKTTASDSIVNEQKGGQALPDQKINQENKSKNNSPANSEENKMEEKNISPTGKKVKLPNPLGSGKRKNASGAKINNEAPTSKNKNQEGQQVEKNLVNNNSQNILESDKVNKIKTGKTKTKKSNNNRLNNGAENIASQTGDEKNNTWKNNNANTQEDITIASAESNGMLSSKTFLLNTNFEVNREQNELITRDIQPVKSKKRRDFDPRLTLGLKTSGYFGVERLLGESKLTLMGSSSFYMQSYPYEFYGYLTEDNTDSYLKNSNDTAIGFARSPVRAMDVGVTSSLRMFGRCYFEMDFAYSQTNWRYAKLYWDNAGNKRVTETLSKEHFRNLQSNLGFSYWFGKRNLEFGLAAGVILRYAKILSDINYAYSQDFWYDGYTLPYRYYSGYYANDNKIGVAGYGQFCMKYNFPKIQLRADIGIPNGWYTSRMSLGVSYKFYTLKQTGYKRIKR